MMYALRPRLDLFPALWRSCSLRSCQSGEEVLKSRRQAFRFFPLNLNIR